MSVETEARAIRRAVALSRSGAACFRLTGPDAYAAADRLCPRELFIRDGQMLHSLLLNEAANPVADLFVCSDGEDFLLLCEGLSPEDLDALIRDRIPAGSRVDIVDATSDHELLSLDGPYAWELLSEATSPEVIGLPYLGFYHGDGFTCFRAGKSGEFSYDLLLPAEGAAAMRERLLDAGAAFGLVSAGPEAMDLCALENFNFNIRRDRHPEATPLELQLQWRVSRGKAFVGSEALRERRGRAARRAVLVSSPSALDAGEAARYGGAAIGTLMHAAYSFEREEWLGVALIDIGLAYSGTPIAFGPDGEKRARVVSAPALNNRSLYVDPQRHAYASRNENTFPPLIRPMRP